MNKTNLVNIYCKSLISRKIHLDFKDVDKNIVRTLEKKLKQDLEGKCCNEGYIKVDSIQVISYSNGELSSNKIIYNVVFQCLITNPVESMIILCNVKSITKVGIRAELKSDDSISPYIIFIARDHHYTNELFSKVKENDVIKVKILGQRFELNDKFISVIGQLIDIDNYETIKTGMIEDINLVKSKSKSRTSSGKIKSKLQVQQQ